LKKQEGGLWRFNMDKEREKSTMHRMAYNQAKSMNDMPLLISSLGYMLEEDRWRSVMCPVRGVPLINETAREYIESEFPKGLGVNAVEVHAHISVVKDEKAARVRAKIEKMVPGIVAEKSAAAHDAVVIMAETKANALREQGPPKGSRNAAKDKIKVDNINVNSEPKGGTGKAYTLRRLARDHPELLEAVKAGNLTANEAAIEAGFRKPPQPPLNKLPEPERLQVLYKTLTETKDWADGLVALLTYNELVIVIEAAKRAVVNKEDE